MPRNVRVSEECRHCIAVALGTSLPVGVNKHRAVEADAAKRSGFGKNAGTASLSLLVRLGVKFLTFIALPF